LDYYFEILISRVSFESSHLLFFKYMLCIFVTDIIIIQDENG